METNSNITIFNARYDRDHRAEVYIPTKILGCSLYESEAANVASGIWSEQSVYKIRVPLLGADIEESRVYLDEKQYATADAEGYWSIKKGDKILLGVYTGGGTPLTSAEVDTIAKEAGERLITVTEYADNTTRGSDTVKHWRIGGK